MTKASAQSHIGLILKRLRQERGWDQAALAMAAGISQAHVSAIEKGRYQSPKAITLAKLAKALKVSISVFFPELEGTEGVAESLTYWEEKGLPTPDEEEFLSLLRDPDIGPELRRHVRMLKRLTQKGQKSV